MIPDGSFHESPKVTADEILFHDMFLTGLSSKKTNLSSSPIVSKEHLSRLFTVLIRLSFLSINRFEKKKNIDLAVSAFAILCKHKLTLSDDVTLTVAGKSVLILNEGGYDERLKERIYLEELKSLAEKEGVSNRVSFITSCPTAERNELLSSCLCVLYTPTDEHFGIVPLGAMAKFVEDPELARGHVVESFSVKTFGEKLN
ncbi:LOW QUALITY PROTEIN: hypothetical protein HID58_057665, partial [Brassica napus]